MSTAETASTAEVTFIIGQTVLFNGYTPDEQGNLPEPQLLQVGERVRIDREQNDGSFVVYALDRKAEDGTEIGDAAFPEELKHTGNAEDLEVSKGKKAGKSGDKKAKASETPAEAVANTQNATVASDDKPKSTKAKGKKAEATVKTSTTTQNDGFEATAEELAAQEGRAAGEGDQTQALPGGVTPAIDTNAAPVITITDSDAVKKILAESKDVIQAAKVLAKRSQQNDFALGGVLNHIRDSGIWKTVTDAVGNPYEGKRGFTQFIKDHLDVDYRKAMYLIQIYTTFRRLGQDEKSLDAIGWSKAKELAALGRLTNEDGEEVGFKELEENFDELAGYAASHSREDLVAEIQKRMASATTDKVKITRYTFKLSGTAAEVADSALAAAEAKVEGDDNKKNSAFEFILADWLMHNADMSMNDVIAAMQNKYGVRLQVVHGDEGTLEDEQEVDQTASA